MLADIVSPFDLNEITARIAALGGALDHGQLLGHAKSQDIVLAPAVAAAASLICRNGQINHKVLIFNEAVFLDAVLDPVGKHLAYLEEGVQLAGIHRVHLNTSDDRAKDRDQAVPVLESCMTWFCGLRRRTAARERVFGDFADNLGDVTAGNAGPSGGFQSVLDVIG